ncbi:MAG: 2-oxo acid dehydrogenase subunit E2 [Hominenteromicrobium sp.]
MFEENIQCEGMDAYIERQAQNGYRFTYLHITIAALVRLIALRPQLNRFVVRGKIFTRPKIWISFVVHQSLRSDSAGTTIKLCFEGTETIRQIAERIDEAVLRETTKKTESNATDKLAGLIMSIPGPLIRFTVNSLIFMDRHNMLPKAIIEASPFHTSLFITNLRSLGINHIFHHVYEFGTTGLFVAIGKEKNVPMLQGDELVRRKCMGFGLVADERFCDGLYFARSLKMLKKYFSNPALLETALEKKEEDVR